MPIQKIDITEISTSTQAQDIQGNNISHCIFLINDKVNLNIPFLMSYFAQTLKIRNITDKQMI